MSLGPSYINQLYSDSFVTSTEKSQSRLRKKGTYCEGIGMSHREKQAQVETGTGNGKAIQTLSPACTPLHIALFSLGNWLGSVLSPCGGTLVP